MGQHHGQQHEHGHHPGHHHGHVDLRAGARHVGRLWWSFALVVGFLVVQVVVGLAANSLALLSDAGHMATDALGLGMALAAITAANRARQAQHRTFGLYRLEILAALANAVLLFAVAGYVLVEAARRLDDPPEVASLPVLIVGAIGLAVNVIAFLLLRQGAKESINVRGAYLEVLADTLGSLGVIGAAAIMWVTGWGWVDPVIGAAIGLFILPRAWRLGRDAVRILVQAAPSGVDIGAITAALAAIEGVADRASDPAFARRLLDRVRDPKTEPWRRALAVEALGGLDGPAVPLVLHAARPGADWVEESCRALALARRGRDDDVGPLIDLLAHAEVAPRIHAWEGLVRLTRQNLPPQREPWATWWEGRRGRLPAPAPAPAVAGAGGDAYTAPEPAHVPTYYGVPVRGRGAACGVVFCLDVSASMSEHGIEPARRHLEATIRELPMRTSFDVVAFNENVSPLWGRLARAHPVAKARAIAWLDAIVPKSFTNLYDAVETAFQCAGLGRSPASEPQHLDLVFVLSDGAPNRGRYHVAEQVVAGIAALSQRRVPVHTIGAGESVLPLLREISAATGGTFQRAED